MKIEMNDSLSGEAIAHLLELYMVIIDDVERSIKNEFANGY